jgi:hypothetical protein
VDILLKSSAGTVLLGNIMQQLPGAEIDTPLRTLFALLFKTPTSDEEQARAGLAAASALVSAVRAVISKLATSAGDSSEQSYRTSLAKAVAAVAKRFGAACAAFRWHVRSLNGTPADEEALARATSMAFADLVTMELEAQRLVAANGLPATYNTPVMGGVLAPTTSAELRVLVQQRDATVAMVDAALERLAVAASSSTDAPTATVVASKEDGAAFTAALLPLAQHADAGAAVSVSCNLC